MEAESGVVKDQNLPVCRICHARVKTKHANTSNLYSHLSKHHPIEYQAVRPKRNGKGKGKASSSTAKECTIEESFKLATKLRSDSREHKELTKAITYYLAKDMRPAYSVELPGFRSMVSKLNPRYGLPSRNYFSRTGIPSLYNEVREEVERKLEGEAAVNFSGTTDLWTSGSSDPYITFTVHYVNSTWQLRSYCLGTTYLAEDHTGENIKESLLEILSEWNLSATKLVAITTDSGSNVKLACALLHWRWLSCFGHNLDLAVRKSFDDRRVTRVLKVCRQVVATFSRSWKKKRDLAKAQHEKQLPLHNLKADCVTRWGSSLAMLERITEQQEAIRIVLASDRKVSHLIPTWQDFDVIDSVIAALGPLGELTDALSAEKNITISAVRPLLTRLSQEILMEKDTDSSLTAQMKRVVRVDLESRYGNSELSNLLDICTFLDPRFRPAEPNDSIIEDIKEEMLSSLQASPLPTQECNSLAESAPPPPKKKKSWLSKILGTTEGNLLLLHFPLQNKLHRKWTGTYIIQYLMSSPLLLSGGKHRKSNFHYLAGLLAVICVSVQLVCPLREFLVLEGTLSQAPGAH